MSREEAVMVDFPNRAAGCDYEGQGAPVYVGMDLAISDPVALVFACRCLVCSRCGRHTGNATQGHYWRLCSRSGHMERFHFCCPSGCELAEGVDQVDGDG